MSQLRVYRPDSTDAGDNGPRLLSFAFYAPLIRAERAMVALREARLKRESVLKFKSPVPRSISLRLFDGHWGR